MSAPPPPYNQNYPQYNPYGNQPPPPGPIYNIQHGVQPIATGHGVQPGYAVYYTQPQTVVVDDCHGHHRHHHRENRGGGAGEACCLAGLMACLCFMCLK